MRDLMALFMAVVVTGSVIACSMVFAGHVQEAGSAFATQTKYAEKRGTQALNGGILRARIHAGEDVFAK